jgi:UDP-2,4-diacetamido-2,4,6-trideoxy-beta-L-altropyranose hydrolase
MRCLALAQAWKEMGLPVTFAMANPVSSLVARLGVDGIEVEPMAEPAGSPADAAQTIALARQVHAEWVVVDGYHLPGSFHRSIKEAGHRLLVLDDSGEVDHSLADVILNQNLHAEPSAYGKRRPGARLLLGPRYTLLRREFRQWRGWKRAIASRARRFLITLGGGDPGNVTAQVIRAVSTITPADREVVIVLGPANPRVEEVCSLCASLGGQFTVLQGAGNMPELMAWADLAITAGGSTCWELAFMGLPSVVLILADNQVAIADSLHAAQAAVNLGWGTSISAQSVAGAVVDLVASPDRRTAMSMRGTQLVDGYGARRVSEFLHQTAQEESVASALSCK